MTSMKETNVLRKHLKDDEILDLVILFQTRRMEAAKTLSAILNLKHIPANTLGCHNLLLTITKELNA